MLFYFFIVFISEKMSMNSQENNYSIDINEVPLQCGASRMLSYTPETYQEEQERIRASQDHNGEETYEETPYRRVMRSYHDEDEVHMLTQRLDLIEKKINEKLIEKEEILKILQRVENLENYLMHDISANGGGIGNRAELEILPRPVLRRQTNVPNVFSEMEEGNATEDMSVSSHSSMPSLISVSEQDDCEQFAQPLDEPDWDTSELYGVYKVTDKNKRVRLTV